MERTGTRRGFLSGTASLLGITWGVAGGALATGGDADEGFDPVEHGYGFRNWAPRDQYFETPERPSRKGIRERVRTSWRDRARTVLGIDPAEASRRLVDAIAHQLRTALVQRAGTNGHCYGMVLTAQQYYEQPAAIPLDRRAASEIDDPTTPVGEPAAPVYEEIVQTQARQFLRFRSWLGRRAMARPDRIDTRRVVRDVRSVVAAFGTASLTIFDRTLYGHQVLAYDVEDHDDGVTIHIYDPNRPAGAYERASPRLRFTRDGDSLSMQPYKRYTHVLYNRFDQIERAADREAVTPLDHRTVGRSTVRGSLFPLALVTVDTGAVSLSVVGPDDTELGRTRSRHMDRTRTDDTLVRSAYGTTPGTYRVRVFGTDSTEYELTATVADPDGPIVDATRSATVEPGERHEYNLEIPEDGTGQLRRTNGDRQGPAVVGGVGVAGGVAAGALGYRALRRRRTETE